MRSSLPPHYPLSFVSCCKIRNRTCSRLWLSTIYQSDRWNQSRLSFRFLLLCHFMSLRGHIYASNISLLFIHLRPVVLHAFIQVFSRIFLRPDLNHRNRISCTCDANIAGTTCHHFPSLSRAPYCRCVPSCPTDHPLRTGRRNVGKTYIVFCLLNRNSDRPQLL